MAWAKDHVIRLSTIEPGHGFADLEPIESIIGDALVIALGEAAHGTHDFLAFRNRLLEFLVHQAGVTALAAETGYAESLDVDAYINGEDVDVMVAAQCVFDDWYPAPLEENLALVEWMRAYNAGAAPGRALRFYGIDLTNYTPDLDYRSLKDAHFPWAVEKMAEFAVEKARSGEGTPKPPNFRELMLR